MLLKTPTESTMKPADPVTLIFRPLSPSPVIFRRPFTALISWSDSGPDWNGTIYKSPLPSGAGVTGVGGSASGSFVATTASRSVVAFALSVGVRPLSR